MRVVFFGSPAFALPSLEALHTAGHDIALVVTQPDRPAGRGQKPTPPPVAMYAREKGLSVWQTRTLRGAEADHVLRETGADAMVLVAFAALVPANLLQIAPGGILNVHPSVLPRWRGAAPIQSALAAGDQGTGVSIIRLVEALDAGPVLLQELVPIAPEDDYVTLEPRLAAVGARLVVRALREQPVPVPQDDSQATYSRRIERDDARIDWTRPVEPIFNQVRAYRGWPGAFTTVDERHLKILRAWPADGPPAEPGTVEATLGVPLVAAGDRWLRLDEVQLEGRRAMSGADLLRGYPGLARAKLA
ncbi:MAG: methionyl-tRNA formyltransferase [Chloroflexi bacterium]|nr:methionyl-tRNA formyltransferase [Chloroflexota bacterium]